MKNDNDHWLLGLVVLMAGVITVIVLHMAIGKTQATYEGKQCVNVDSIRRRAQRVMVERVRESSLKTLEDSIHYYEDGM